MNIKHKFALTLASGVAIGLAAEGAINAQQVKPTPGYFVGCAADDRSRHGAMLNMSAFGG